MASLELKLLGGLEVIRDGASLELPPSKKTRALLVYLALNGRAFRREHLCDLLWEVPDDPRGSLRWSLSKLRRLVDDDARQRVIADRASVRFDASDVAIDVTALHAPLVHQPRGETQDDDVEEAADQQPEHADDAGQYGRRHLQGSGQVGVRSGPVRSPRTN